MSNSTFSLRSIKNYASEYLQTIDNNEITQSVIDTLKKISKTDHNTLSNLANVFNISDNRIDDIRFTYASYVQSSSDNQIPNGMITREKAIQNSEIENDEQRVNIAKGILQVNQFTAAQEKAILKAHYEIHGGVPFILLNASQRNDKKKVLVNEGGFTENQADQLIYNVICGSGLKNGILISLILILGRGLRYTDGGANIEKIPQLREKVIGDKKEDGKNEHDEEEDKENTSGKKDSDDEDNGDLEVEEPTLDTIQKTSSGTLSTYGEIEETDLTNFFNLHQIKGLRLGKTDKKFDIPNSGIQSVTLQNTPRINFAQFGFARKNFMNEVEYSRSDQYELNKESGTKRVIQRKLHFKFTKPLSLQEIDVDANTEEIDRSESLFKHAKKIVGAGKEEEEILKSYYNQMFTIALREAQEEAKQYLSKNHPRVAKSALENMIALFIENVDIANGEEIPTELIVEFGLPTGEYYICKRKTNGKITCDLYGVPKQADTSEFQEMFGDGNITIKSGKIKATRN